MNKKSDAGWRAEGKKVRVSGKDDFLWQAIDEPGEVLDFHVTKTEDEAASVRFFQKILPALTV